MKYRKEYLETKSRDAFIKVVLKKFKEIKPETAKRRWYDLRKNLGDQEALIEINAIPTREEQRTTITPVMVGEDDLPIREPNQLRLLQYLDMKRYKHKTTRKYLSNQGFSEEELNWMEERNMVEGEEG